MTPLEKRSLMSSLQELPENERVSVLKELGDEHSYCLMWDWEYHARENQLLPDGDWSYWLILAGRGFGKTRTGAEVVRQWARTNQYVNLIGATTDDARDIMIEGESGIMSVCPKMNARTTLSMHVSWFGLAVVCLLSSQQTNPSDFAASSMKSYGGMNWARGGIQKHGIKLSLAYG